MWLGRRFIDMLALAGRPVRRGRAGRTGNQTPATRDVADEHEVIGTGMRAAVSSFAFFASGVTIPVIPFLLGAQSSTALIIATVLVGLALIRTGGVVGPVICRGPTQTLHASGRHRLRSRRGHLSARALVRYDHELRHQGRVSDFQQSPPPPPASGPSRPVTMGHVNSYAHEGVRDDCTDIAEVPGSRSWFDR